MHGQPAAGTATGDLTDDATAPEGTTDRERPARQRLVDAAIAHFAAEGLADQSLRRIAEAVGTSHRMLLYHFGSKDGLLLEVAREMERRTESRLAELSREAGGATDETIRRMWTYLADPALGDFERLFFALYGRALQGDESIQPLLRDDITHWLDANERLSTPLGVPAEVVRAHARLGLAVVRGLLLDLLATGDRAGVDEALALFAGRYRGRWWETQEDTGTSDRAS
jgi:AcrR family transcriptional regulator